jgi:ComF family protein
MAILDLLFPPRCGGCDSGGHWFCDRCRRALRPERAPRPHRVREVIALGRFEGALRRAVHRLKYEGEAVLAGPLGVELGAVVARGLALGWRVDALVPVPLSSARRRERGFDQAALLAGHASRACGVPVRRCVRRLRATESQVGLGRAERLENMRGAFAAAFSPARVTLVDDVATTGATLAACAEALRRVGTREVRAVVVAVER